MENNFLSMFHDFLRHKWAIWAVFRRKTFWSRYSWTSINETNLTINSYNRNSDLSSFLLLRCIRRFQYWYYRKVWFYEIVRFSKSTESKDFSLTLRLILELRIGFSRHDVRARSHNGLQSRRRFDSLLLASLLGGAFVGSLVPFFAAGLSALLVPRRLDLAGPIVAARLPQVNRVHGISLSAQRSIYSSIVSLRFDELCIQSLFDRLKIHGFRIIVTKFH